MSTLKKPRCNIVSVMGELDPEQEYTPSTDDEDHEDDAYSTHSSHKSHLPEILVTAAASDVPSEYLPMNNVSGSNVQESSPSSEKKEIQQNQDIAEYMVPTPRPEVPTRRPVLPPKSPLGQSKLLESKRPPPPDHEPPGVTQGDVLGPSLEEDRHSRTFQVDVIGSEDDKKGNILSRTFKGLFKQTKRQSPGSSKDDDGELSSPSAGSSTDSGTVSKRISEDDRGYVTCSSSTSSRHVSIEKADSVDFTDYLPIKDFGPSSAAISENDDENLYAEVKTTTTEVKDPKSAIEKSDRKAREKQAKKKKDGNTRDTGNVFTKRTRSQDASNPRSLPPIPQDEQLVAKAFSQYPNIAGHRKLTGSTTNLSVWKESDRESAFHIFSSIDEVPLEIAGLSKEEVADCLRLIGLGGRSEIFLQQDIDGFLLKNLTEGALAEIGLDKMETCKVISFAKGWRPNRSVNIASAHTGRVSSGTPGSSLYDVPPNNNKAV